MVFLSQIFDPQNVHPTHAKFKNMACLRLFTHSSHTWCELAGRPTVFMEALGVAAATYHDIFLNLKLLLPYTEAHTSQLSLNADWIQSVLAKCQIQNFPDLSSSTLTVCTCTNSSENSWFRKQGETVQEIFAQWNKHFILSYRQTTSQFS